MHDASPSSAARTPMNGYEFALKVFEHFGDEAVERFLRAARDGEADWFEKKAAVYPSADHDTDYTKLLSETEQDNLDEAKKRYRQTILKEIACAVVAIHNSRGGVVLIGVDDANHPVPLLEGDADSVEEDVPEAVIREKILGALFGQVGTQKVKKFKCETGTWAVPQVDGVVSKRCRFKGQTVLLLFVPARETGKPPLVATKPDNGKPVKVLLLRTPGDVGQTQKRTIEEECSVETESQRAEFEAKRKTAYLDRFDLNVEFGVLTRVVPCFVDRPRAPLFVGRDKELMHLHELLNASRIPVITGPGGTGKTELVLQYASRHKADYPGGLFQIGMEGLSDWESAFRMMLERPGIRDALGLPENDHAEMEGLTELRSDSILSEMVGDLGMPFDPGPRGAAVRKKKSVLEILSARASREGPILLLLDNVDPPACKTLFKETVLSKLNLPSELRIVATAQASDFTFPVNGACKEYELHDFSPDFSPHVAVDFLTAAHPADSEAERKAVESVAYLLGYRILYLEAVPSLMGDDDSPFAGSWQALERGLRDDLESVVDMGMEGDEARTPAALWRQKERLFASNRSNGVRWILLARIASFFSPDLGVRKTVLSSLWKRLAKPEGDPDIAFSQAANKLRKHGVLEDRGGEFGMHRLTRAAICESARNEEPDLEESIGSALSETGLSEGRDWVSLAGSLTALRHVPEVLLDGRTSVDILCNNIQFADQCPWARLDFFDWKKLLGIHPQLIDRLQQSAEGGSADAQAFFGVCYEQGCGVEQNDGNAAKWYRMAADQGNGPAQNNLGMCYHEGRGVEQNYEEGVKWYRKAAEEGWAVAQYNLGYCYNNGKGVEQNAEEAVNWYRKAADQGNAAAQCNLGLCYDNGQGIEQNSEEAVKWYRKAVEQGDAAAQCNLGRCYNNGKGVEQSTEEAVKWYHKAANQGNAAAQFNLGLCYYDGQGIEQSTEEAVEWFRKAAEQGHPPAQYNLGVCYYNGKGVEQSVEEAVKWYRKAAERGDAAAQYNLGVCYDNGEGVEQSAEEAVKWYRKAAKQGHADAQCNLGVCYDNGIGVEQSAEEAVKWFRKAAERGNAAAQCNLGVCYGNGKGVEQSAEEAVKWFRKAAEQGAAAAQYNLGVCYDNGEGVEQSAEEAVKWYRKAAEQGYADAQYNLDVCYDNGKGVEQNAEVAGKWYQKAAEQGQTPA